MNKKIVKIISLMVTLVLLFTISTCLIVNSKSIKTSINIPTQSNVDPTTNFFGQTDSASLVDLVLDDTVISDRGYVKVCTNDFLELFVDEKTTGIAVYDKQAKYAWYSTYYHSDTENAKSSKYSSIKEMLTSGVTIECFDSSSLNEVTKYSANATECEKKYTYLDDGFKVQLNFVKVGVTFSVKVTLNNANIEAQILLDELQEVPYVSKALKNPKEYKLKAITLFPYLGSENYEINGYAFIPDGSGALIRFNNEEYNTAYIKRVYGNDSGVTRESNSDYLKDENLITLPIYGISHGYNQAAVLVNVNNGASCAELNAYPYMYSNLNLNRTYFRYILREKFNVAISSSTTGIVSFINSDIYTNNIKTTYTFLNNDKANYVGMANAYKETIDFTKDNKLDSSVKLDVVAQDYKKGLFGKNYIEMTTYSALENILKTLKQNNVNDIEINYIGYNNNGYFDNMQSKVKLDNNLGSKKDYESLIKYIEDQGFDIYYYTNPMIVNENSVIKSVKRENLEQFTYDFKSSLEVSGKVMLPTLIAKNITKNQKAYKKLDINNLSLDLIGSFAFTYRYNGNTVYREEMIEQVCTELEKLTSYKLAMSKPNNYMYKYLSSYYNANFESSKYAFITDSIPFVSIVLAGNVKMYSTNINYVSDYNLFILRLIEYNINPSFVITNETTDKLRYCNYEYLFSTCITSWQDLIIDSYQKVSSVLNKTKGASITSHSYLSDGVVEIGYSNGVKVYVNYTKTPYTVSSSDIQPMSYLVIGGGSIA